MDTCAWKRCRALAYVSYRPTDKTESVFLCENHWRKVSECETLRERLVCWNAVGMLEVWAQVWKNRKRCAWKECNAAATHEFDGIALCYIHYHRAEKISKKIPLPSCNQI